MSLTATQTTTTSLSLSWDPPQFDLQNGIIRYYIVYVSDLTNDTNIDFSTNETQILIESLRPYYLYNCSVAAFTIGLGPVSDSLMVRLPQAGKQHMDYITIVQDIV